MTKFRAWDNVDYMSSPFTLYDIQDGKVQFTKDAAIMEFVGQKDRNGIEVCEGDVLKYISNGILQYRLVFWLDHENGWFTKNIHFDDDIIYGLGWLLHNGTIDAIGNQYQDPELLRGSKKYTLKINYHE